MALCVLLRGLCFSLFLLSIELQSVELFELLFKIVVHLKICMILWIRFSAAFVKAISEQPAMYKIDIFVYCSQ